jgi:hypothetical protein
MLHFDANQCDQSARMFFLCMWQPISTAPFDRDLELAVLDEEEAHSLVFPCRRILGGWVNAETRARVDIRPTHWREWPQEA